MYKRIIRLKLELSDNEYNARVENNCQLLEKSPITAIYFPEQEV